VTDSRLWISFLQVVVTTHLYFKDPSFARW